MNIIHDDALPISVIMNEERTDIMTEITERATITKKSMERATITKNSMERAALMYVITEQYRTWNRNDHPYGTTVMTYITALKSEWKDVQV